MFNFQEYLLHTFIAKKSPSLYLSLLLLQLQVKIFLFKQTLETPGSLTPPLDSTAMEMLHVWILIKYLCSNLKHKFANNTLFFPNLLHSSNLLIARQDELLLIFSRNQSNFGQVRFN